MWSGPRLALQRRRGPLLCLQDVSSLERTLSKLLIAANDLADAGVVQTNLAGDIALRQTRFLCSFEAPAPCDAGLVALCVCALELDLGLTHLGAGLVLVVG